MFKKKYYIWTGVFEEEYYEGGGSFERGREKEEKWGRCFDGDLRCQEIGWRDEC